MIYYIIIQIGLLGMIQWSMGTGAGQLTGLLQFLPAVVTFVTVVLWHVKNGKGERPSWGETGLLLIIVGDFFLCLKEGDYGRIGDGLGYAAFCMVQLCIALWIGGGKGERIFRGGLLIGAEIALKYSGLLDLPNMLAVANLTLLAGNMLLAWRRYAKLGERRVKYLAAGLTCFCGCDFGLLFFALLAPGSIRKTVGMIVWLCYVPAQILLTDSLGRRNKMQRLL